MRSIYAAVNWAISIAEDDTHGYDQEHRNGPDYDCSSFVSTALNKGGFNIAVTSWTGNMYDQLIADGWTTAPINSQRGIGHIFLNTAHHVIMCIDENRIVQASINEKGTATGGQTGDQTGREIYVGDYYNYSYGWDYHLVPPPDSYIDGEPLPDAAWHTKSSGAYARTSTEAFENGIMAFKKLSALGWSVNAIAGLWGNVEYEGGYNPWRWESDIILASTDTDEIQTSRVHGYGLTQFTPAGKYIYSIANTMYGYGPNYSDVAGNTDDGDAQLEYVDGYADYYQTTAYPIPFSDFKTSTLPPDELAAAWVYNYERPGNPSATIAGRREAAIYWYNIFIKYDPLSPSFGKSKFNIMFYLKPKHKKLFT